MKAKLLFAVASVSLFLLCGPSASAAPKACGGQSITNSNHFSYSELTLSSYSFNGSGGSIGFSFVVTAPSGGQVFPDCGSADTAQFFVQGVTEVTDASGNSVNLDLGTTSGIGAQIASAFSFSPSLNAFTVGQTVPVVVTLLNPNLPSTAYGTYSIKLAAKEEIPTSTGIGVSSGVTFTLVLGAPLTACSDTSKPLVTPVDPNNVAQELGSIPVIFTAVDPTVAGCSDQLVTMDDMVKSAGGTDHSSELGTLSEIPTLPQAAGVLVTATGSFMPQGWSGSTGTVNGNPFTASFLSGIGNYTVTETASDSNGNTGQATDTFGVDYDVEFTTERPEGNSGQVHFEFNVNRSSATSDGAFMVDETVAVAIRLATKATNPTNPSDTSVYLATHFYGCADPHANVKITTTTGAGCSTAAGNTYLTFFKNSEWSASSSQTYVADVFFKDVDGNWRYEGSSSSQTF